jgi:hypothetical protein
VEKAIRSTPIPQLSSFKCGFFKLYTIFYYYLWSFDGGISNKVVGCYVGEQFEGDIVLVRIYGAGTNNFVDRKSELRYIKYLSEQGMCPPLYATFNNGRAYAYCSGVTLDYERFKTYRQ